MNIENLRFKQKKALVEHALKIYGVTEQAEQVKSRWVEHLLCGGDLQQLIDALKHGRSKVPTIKIAGTQSYTSGSIKLASAASAFYACDSCQLTVVVENQSSKVWQTTADTPIALCYHWYFENGDVCDFDGLRTPLIAPLRSGETGSFSMNIRTPSQVGTYRLELTMIMEGHFWFENKDFQSLSTEVNVEMKRLSSHAMSIYKSLMSAIKQQTQGMH